MKGNVKKGAEIFKQQSCAACHTVEKGAKAVGPQLVDIGKRYKRIELLESIIKPNAKIAQGFATQIFATEEGLTYTGFVTREAGNEVEIRDCRRQVSRHFEEHYRSSQGIKKISHARRLGEQFECETNGVVAGIP